MLWWLSSIKLLISGGSQEGNKWLSSEIIFTTKPTYCKWLTLTYADAMTDHTKVYEDGKMFLRRFQRYLNKSEEIFDSQKTFKRITIVEPQGERHNNAWHLHILLIFDAPAHLLRMR